MSLSGSSESNHAKSEQHQALSPTDEFQSRWNHLIAKVTSQIRGLTELPEVLQATVDELNGLLRCDRVLIYQFAPDWSGQVVVEAVSDSRWSLLDRVVHDACFEAYWLESYHENQVRAIADVSTANLSPGYAKFLADFEVKANLVVPLFYDSQLWGLLIAHTCTASRPWSEAEITGLQQIAVPVSIAIYQADLRAQLQAARANLSAQTAARTAKLEQTNLQLSTRVQECNTTTIALQQRDIFLRQVLDSLFSFVGVLSPDGILMEANQALLEVAGLTREDVIGKPFAEAYCWQYSPEAQAQIRGAIAQANQGNSVRFDIPVQVQGGDRIIIDFSLNPLRSGNGPITHLISSGIDITQRIQAEAERQTASDQIAEQLLAIESTIDGIAILREGSYHYLNPSHVEMFGYSSADELLGQSWQMLYAAEEVDRFQREVFPKLEKSGHWRGEAIATRKDGSTFYEEVSLTLNGNGDLICVCCNITKRKLTEIALRQSRDERIQLAAIVESSQDAIISKTPDGMITSWNSAAEQLFGYTAQEAIGQSVVMLIPPERRLEAALILERIRQGEQVEPYETQRQRKDSSLVDVALTVSPIRDENGVVVGASKIARDISAQRQAQQVLQEQTAILSSFYNSSPFMMGVVELSETDIFHVSDNQATATFFHTTVEALKGQWATDLGAPLEHIQTWIEHYRTSQIQQQPVRFEYAHVTDTDTYWLSISVSFIGMGENQRPRFSYVAEDISDRKQTDLQLRHLSDRLELAVESAQIGIWDLDLVNNHLIWDDQVYAIYGIQASNFTGAYEAWITSVHPDDRAYCQMIHEQTLAGERDYHCEFRIVRPDGTCRYVESYAILQRAPDGQPVRMTGVNIDVTDRKTTELDLQSTKEQLELVLQASSEGFWDWNLITHEIYFSPQWKAMLGYADHELENSFSMWESLIFDEDRMAALQLVEDYNSGKVSQFEAIQRFHHKNGSTVYILSRALHLKDAEGKAIRMVGSHLDVTENKRQEFALQKSEARYRNIIETTTEGVWMVDVENLTSFVNPRMTTLLGYDAEEMMGQPLFAFMTEENRLLAQAQLSNRHEGVSEQYEFEFQRKDGASLWVLVSASPILDEVGQYAGAIAMMTDITDRKRAEQAVRQSEERFRHIAETIQDVFFINTPIVHRVDYVSPAYETIWGRPRQDLYEHPESWLNSIHPEDRARIEVVLQHQVAGQPFQQEYRIIRPDGSVRWIYSRTFPKFNEAGEVENTIGLASDITDRKQAELALQESEDRFRVLVTHAPVGIFQTDAQGKCLYVNPRWLEMTGLSAADAMEFGWQQALHPDDREAIITEWTQATQEGRPFGLEYRFQKPDSSVIWVSGQAIAVPNESGEIHRYFGTVMDITDRKRAEEDLRQQKEMFQAIVDHIPIMIALFNAQGRMDFINPEFERTLGWSLADWQQQQDALLNFYPDSRGHRDILVHIRSARRNWSDFTVQTAMHQPLETTWVGVPLSQGRSLGIGQDISDRKRKELALRQAMEAAEAANLAKSMFLANMSHELRTPLNVILGFTQVMSHDLSLTSSQHEDLQTIQRSGDHLLSLINDILDLSKIEAGHCNLEETGFDLISLLQGLHTMMSERATSKGLQLIFDIASGIPQFIIADEQKLRQVLLNLLSNAIKFTRQGSVTLRVTWQESLDKVCSSVKVAPNGEHLKSCLPTPVYTLQFETIDTGIGIAPEEQESIFEAFVQAEAGRKSTSGTGLGLAISRKLIELMHGQISVHSNLNVGSTFTVTVTVNVCSTHEIVMQSDRCDRTITGLLPGQPHYRILVVDDQRENRLLMVRLLTRIGLQVREAASGQEAIQLWQDWQPDLTWMDIRMPGLDGYEATRQIRSMEQQPASIIIALTAQASQEDRALALTAGCNDYINKPFREETIFLKMAEYLGLEYEYAESEDSQNRSFIIQSNVEHDSSRIFDPTIIAQLPSNWLYYLEEATISGKDRAIIELTNQLSPELATFSNYLSALANQFEFEQILSWIYHVSQERTNDNS